MDDLRAGLKEGQEEPRTSWTKRQGSAPRMTGTRHKDTEQHGYSGKQCNNSYRVKYTLTLPPTHFLPTRNRNTCPHEDWFVSDHSSFIHNDPKLEIPSTVE